eukprot:Hpha_TRINITY_DN14970_c0_g2::TRINITY_DN14970_c0_g2_i1::g.144151::m.144151
MSRPSSGYHRAPSRGSNPSRPTSRELDRTSVRWSAFAGSEAEGILTEVFESLDTQRSGTVPREDVHQRIRDATMKRRLAAAVAGDRGSPGPPSEVPVERLLSRIALWGQKGDKNAEITWHELELHASDTLRAPLQAPDGSIVLGGAVLPTSGLSNEQIAVLRGFADEVHEQNLDVGRLVEEVENLRRQVRDGRELVAGRERRIAELAAGEAADVQAFKDSKVKVIRELERKVEDLTAELAARDASVRHSELQVSQHLSRITKLSMQLDELKATPSVPAEELRQQAAEAQAEADEERKRHAEAAAALAAAKASFGRVETERHELEGDLNTRVQRAEELEKELAAARADLRSFRASITAEMEKHQSALQESNDRVRAALADLQQERTSAREKQSALHRVETELQEKGLEVTRLEDDVTRLRGELAALRNVESGLRVDLHELQIINKERDEALAQALVSAQEEHSNLSHQMRGIDETRRGIEEERRGIDEQKRGIDEEKRGIDEQRRGIDEQKRGIDEVKRGIEEEKRGVDEWKRVIGEERQEIQEERRGMHDERLAMEEERRKMAGERRSIEDERKQMEALAAAVEAQATKLRRVNDDLYDIVGAGGEGRKTSGMSDSSRRMSNAAVLPAEVDRAATLREVLAGKFEERRDRDLRTQSELQRASESLENERKKASIERALASVAELETGGRHALRSEEDAARALLAAQRIADTRSAVRTGWEMSAAEESDRQRILLEQAWTMARLEMRVGHQGAAAAAARRDLEAEEDTRRRAVAAAEAAAARDLVAMEARDAFAARGVSRLLPEERLGRAAVQSDEATEFAVIRNLASATGQVLADGERRALEQRTAARKRLCAEEEGARDGMQSEERVARAKIDFLRAAARTELQEYETRGDVEDHEAAEYGVLLIAEEASIEQAMEATERAERATRDRDRELVFSSSPSPGSPGGEKKKKKHTAYLGLEVSEGIVVGRSEGCAGSHIDSEGHTVALDGVKIFAVTPGGPAHQAGLVSGDLIVEFNGAEIHGLPDFRAAALKTRPGEEVELGIQPFDGGDGVIEHVVLESGKVAKDEWEPGRHRTIGYRVPVLTRIETLASQRQARESVRQEERRKLTVGVVSPSRRRGMSSITVQSTAVRNSYGRRGHTDL